MYWGKRLKDTEKRICASWSPFIDLLRRRRLEQEKESSRLLFRSWSSSYVLRRRLRCSTRLSLSMHRSASYQQKGTRIDASAATTTILLVSGANSFIISSPLLVVLHEYNGTCSKQARLILLRAFLLLALILSL